MALSTRLCVVCSSSFIPPERASKVCSDHCRKVRRYTMQNAARRARYATDPERFREYQRQWLDNNPTKKVLQHVRALEWKNNNPDRRRAHGRLASQKRRAAINNPLGRGFTQHDWQYICEYYHHRCAYCGVKSDSLTIDHVIPLSRNGLHDPMNIVPACRSCNFAKGARPVGEFVAQLSQRTLQLEVTT